LKKIIENLEITEFAAEGKSLGKKDGKVYFTAYTAPGDVVDIRLIQKRKSYSIGRVLEFKDSSKKRREPFCDHFGLCGGCQWQHVALSEQLKFKQQQVKDSLERIAGISTEMIKPIIPSPQETEYRNKLEFSFADSRWLSKEEIDSGEVMDKNGLGFHPPGRFNRIIDIRKCHLQKEPSNKIRNWIRDYALKSSLPFFNYGNHRGFWRTLMLRNNSKGEWMVFFQFARKERDFISKLGADMSKAFPEVKSISYAINQKKNDTFFDLDIIPIISQANIFEYLGPLQIKIGPKSFLQTNLAQALNIYDEILNLAEFSGKELVWDLYSGVGSIALYIAPRVKKVIGIENIEMAVEDARENAKINNIENTNFLFGDVKDLILKRENELSEDPDLVIVDPPREGLHKDCINALLELSTPGIIYVSCKPSTQARDIKLFSEKYVVERIQAFDMFPYTHHIENVVFLKRK
jgi:23S rRNA (uracil1939-C5)-methyltransferase